MEVKRNKLHSFLSKTKSGSVDVALFGQVVKSGWGSDPEPDVMEQLEERFTERIAVNNNKLDSTPLHLACFREHVEVAELLLQNGSDPNIQDSCGLTPFHLACMRGNLTLVTLLETHSADPCIKSVDDETPLQVPCQCFNVESI